MKKKLISIMSIVLLLSVIFSVPTVATTSESQSITTPELFISHLSDNSVTLNWEEVENATKYIVMYKNKKDNRYISLDIVYDTDYTFNNLFDNSKCYFVVVAQSNTKVSNYSNEIAVCYKSK